MIGKFKLAKVNILISVIVVIGFITTGIINYQTYSRIIKEEIENISKLTSTNIYSEINNELTKPIFVSLTMANDTFLKDWLNNEDINPYEKQKSLLAYLQGIKMKYNYNSVFLISENSKKYYHFNGLNKIVSRQDDHDKWYFNFIDKAIQYQLDVDLDEADNHAMTVFINCRITDSLNNLMGVTGVGVKMEEIQSILNRYEEDYDLEAFLVDKQGLVQVHTDSAKIEKLNVFDRMLKPFKGKIITNKSTMETFEYDENDMKGYIITRYIDDLDWYLVIKKDTSILNETYTEHLASDLFILVLVIGLILLLTCGVVNYYKKHIEKLAKVDQLTELMNRRGFDDLLSRKLENTKKEYSNYIFILDIDSFKEINDTYGHLFGDEILKTISRIVKDALGDKGTLARWGGDEFVGTLNIEDGKLECFFEKLMENIHSDQDLNEYKVTISLGATKVRKLDTPDLVLGRADQALYDVKNTGKDDYKII